MSEPEVELTADSVRSDGADVAYDVCGSGDPVLLLHAGIADRRMWDPQLPALAARYRVIRVDLRGFGETRSDASPFAHHEDVAAVLDALGVRRAFLVGASLGGAVALDVALHHPDAVAGLILIGAAVDGYRFEEGDLHDGWRRVHELVTVGDLEAAAELEISLWVAGPERLADELDDDLRSRIRGMLLDSYTTRAGEERAPAGPPTVDRLGEITAPTLVLVGTLDRPDIHRIARVLAERLPAVRRIGVAGVAHLPNLETPERVDRLILEFLEEVEAGAFPGAG